MTEKTPVERKELNKKKCDLCEKTEGGGFVELREGKRRLGRDNRKKVVMMRILSKGIPWLLQILA